MNVEPIKDSIMKGVVSILGKKKKKKHKVKSRRELHIESFTEKTKMMFDNMTEKEQNEFISSLNLFDDYQTLNEIKKEHKEDKKRERKLEEVRAKAMTKAKSFSEITNQLRKEKKKIKRLNKIIEKEKGIARILNPESYDQLKIDIREYRKDLKKIAKHERDEMGRAGIDCTLKSYKDALKENEAYLPGEFYLKHGF